MRKSILFIALNVGGAIGWSAGEPFGIWAALLASTVGSIGGIWLAWRYREYFGG